MRYVQLGRSGLKVSVLALGALGFGKGRTGLDALHRTEETTARHLVDRAIDAGVTYFNTADVYAEGHSEAILGAAIGSRRSDVVIATKLGLPCSAAPTGRGLSRRHIVESVEGSLTRLNTDWIDVLVLHCSDPTTPLEETLAALQALIEQGKVRYIGISNWPGWLTAKAAAIQAERRWEPFRAAEVYYSLLGREVEHEIVPMALDAGIGLQVWSPLAGGALAGGRSPAQLQRGDRMSSLDFLPFDRAKAPSVLDGLARIASRIGVSPAQLAIAWLLHRPAVSSVIVGCSTPAQLDDNLGAAEIVLDSETMEEVTGLLPLDPIYPEWYDRTLRQSWLGD